MSQYSEILTGTTDSHIQYFNNGIGLHKEVFEPFITMQKAAAIDGIDLKIASGFRSFERQLSIFNRKLKGQTPVRDFDNNVVDITRLNAQDKLKHILLYSALPGASRHHWGTDIDVYDPTLLNGDELKLEPWEYACDGPLAPLTRWLNTHMESFGFYRPYDQYRGGVAPEPWHISYYPIADTFTDIIDANIICECIATSEIEDKTVILDMVKEICQQYIQNIGRI